jgi:hypothetical protein
MCQSPSSFLVCVTVADVINPKTQQQKAVLSCSGSSLLLT